MSLTTLFRDLVHPKRPVPALSDKRFIFITGVHRSGTSLLHDALRQHPEVSGFSNTGKPKDEGQHLQRVIPSDRKLGGPGKFAFNPDSYMDEDHELATNKTADALYRSWGRHWDLKREFLLEKSPPTIIRTRFFQKLFPDAVFVVILRHPIPVAYATIKWARSSVFSLIEHTLLCYERLRSDKEHVRNIFICRFEDLLVRPQQLTAEIRAFAGLPAHDPPFNIDPQSNRAYFAQWGVELDRLGRHRNALERTYENIFGSRMTALGYRFDDPDHFTPVDWIDGR